MIYWTVELAKYPLRAKIKDSDLSYEAKLLPDGLEKVQSKDDFNRDAFVPGQDYEIKRDIKEAPWVP